MNFILTDRQIVEESNLSLLYYCASRLIYIIINAFQVVKPH